MLLAVLSKLHESSFDNTAQTFFPDIVVKIAIITSLLHLLTLARLLLFP